MNKNSLWYKTYEYLWSLFLNGLLLLLPATLTFTIFSLTFKLIKSWLAPLKELDLPFISMIPHGEVFLVLGIILGCGFFVKSFLMNSIMHVVDNILNNVPIIRPVYTGVKQLVHAFSPQDHSTFKKVVFVEFPRKGMYSIGFLTSEISKEFAPASHEPLYSIFVPTTPNPTTGFFIVVPAQDFTITKLTTQEAMALIISGGIIQPEQTEQS